MMLITSNAEGDTALPQRASLFVVLSFHPKTLSTP
jgi:hypothetical protein